MNAGGRCAHDDAPAGTGPSVKPDMRRGLSTGDSAWLRRLKVRDPRRWAVMTAILCRVYVCACAYVCGETGTHETCSQCQQRERETESESERERERAIERQRHAREGRRMCGRQRHRCVVHGARSLRVLAD